MYQIKTNTHEFNIDPNEAFDWDLLDLGDGHFNIIKDDRSYRAELVSFDPEAKTFSIKINEHLVHLEVKDQMDLLLEKMGISTANSNKINHIKAPMPGLVLDIRVKPGQEISKGDAVLVLEAMKMENILKSPSDAVVKSIEVESGIAVEKGQVLVLFE